VTGEWVDPEQAVRELGRVNRALNDARTGGPPFVMVGAEATVNANEVVSVTLDDESAGPLFA